MIERPKPAKISACIFRVVRIPVLISTALLLTSGCVLIPTWKKLTDDGNLVSSQIETERFQHLVLSNRIPGKHLRIYVEGDGYPWIRGSRVAVDPTPSNPVLLELMHDATHAAVYLGRPCYFGRATSRNCDSRWWTADRYSTDVVESMCAAANELSTSRYAETVQLIGYSGGGTIVTRMRNCTDRLISIVTIAANLDPDGWAEHHGYSPLSRYRAPPASGKTAKLIHEVHWQCRDDTIVPPSLTDAYFAMWPKATRVVIDGCSHSTGWNTFWPRIVDYSPAK